MSPYVVSFWDYKGRANKNNSYMFTNGGKDYLAKKPWMDVWAIRAVIDKEKNTNEKDGKTVKKDTRKFKSRMLAHDTFKPNIRNRFFFTDSGIPSVHFTAPQAQCQLKRVYMLIKQGDNARQYYDKECYVSIYDTKMNLLAEESFLVSKIPIKGKWFPLMMPKIDLPKDFLVSVDFTRDTNMKPVAGICIEQYQGEKENNTSYNLSRNGQQYLNNIPSKEKWALRVQIGVPR